MRINRIIVRRVLHHEKNPKASTVTAIASVTIALAAVFLSVWQGAETRQHNRLSVTPKLVLTKDMRQEAGSIGIFIANEGLGPAIIRDIVISVGEAQYDVNTREGWIDVLDHLEINERWIQWFAISEGTYFRAGQSDFLLAADRDKINVSEELRLTQATSQLKVRIEYESVYGDEFQEEQDWKQ